VSASTVASQAHNAEMNKRDLAKETRAAFQGRFESRGVQAMFNRRMKELVGALFHQLRQRLDSATASPSQSPPTALHPVESTQRSSTDSGSAAADSSPAVLSVASFKFGDTVEEFRLHP
jgi:hypothetical protein